MSAPVGNIKVLSFVRRLQTMVSLRPVLSQLSPYCITTYTDENLNVPGNVQRIKVKGVLILAMCSRLQLKVF